MSDSLAQWNNFYLNMMTARRSGLDSVEYWRNLGKSIRKEAWHERCVIRLKRDLQDALDDYSGLRSMLKCPDDSDLASWIDRLLVPDEFIEALRFYADPVNWMIWINHPEFESEIQKDKGKRAKDAISKYRWLARRL